MKSFSPFVYKIKIDSSDQRISPGSAFSVPNSEKSFWFSSIKLRLTHSGPSGLIGYESC